MDFWFSPLAKKDLQSPPVVARPKKGKKTGPRLEKEKKGDVSQAAGPGGKNPRNDHRKEGEDTILSVDAFKKKGGRMVDNVCSPAMGIDGKITYSEGSWCRGEGRKKRDGPVSSKEKKGFPRRKRRKAKAPQ